MQNVTWQRSIGNHICETDMQVGDPLQLVQKLAVAPAIPLIADLRKLQRSLDAMLQLAIELMQQDLAASLEEMLSFLHGWFDFQEQSQIGILLPGNAELDALKDQYSALPNLLRSVRSAIMGAVLATLGNGMIRTIHVAGC